MNDALLLTCIALVSAGSALNWRVAKHMRQTVDRGHECLRDGLLAIEKAGILAHGYLAMKADRDALIGMIHQCGDDAARQWIADRYASHEKESVH